MWRKPADAKNPSQSSNVPEPVTTAKTGQTSVTGTTPATAVPSGPVPIAQTATAASAQISAASYSSPASAGNPFAAAPRASSVSVIGAGLKIQGEITGDSDLVIEGEAHGRIRMVNGRVTVAANGRVNADIEAVEISVEGRVQGGLKASDRVRLGPASHVQGSVMTPRIAIEDGARLRGKVEMIRAGEAPATVMGSKVATSGTPVAATPVPNAPKATPVTSAAAPATSPVANTTPNPPKAGDATDAAATDPDRMKANAARVSGD